MKARLKNDHGVSMMEMMIALVIVGLLAALAVPNMGGAIKKMKFDNDGRDMVSTLRLARSMAITLQQPVGVYFDTNDKKVLTFIDLVNAGSNTYDPGDSIVHHDSLEAPVSYFGTTFTGQTVVFQPDGTASAGGYVVAHGYLGTVTRSYTVAVTGGSGRVRLDFYN